MTMLSKEGFEIYVKDLYTGQFPSGEAPGKLRALLAHDAEQRRVIEGLSAKVKNLTAWSDRMFGTPCAEIRHQQQVEMLEEKIKQQAQEIARLENGLGCTRSHPHEDMSQICELRTEVARLKNELSQRTNLEGSAPCWNSAHMKQIATLREALRWDGLKVSEENIQWALKELGPAGTRAEAYVQAVVEFAIHMRRIAQQALKETVT